MLPWYERGLESQDIAAVLLTEPHDVGRVNSEGMVMESHVARCGLRLLCMYM